VSLKKPSEFFYKNTQAPSLVENYSAIELPMNGASKSLNDTFNRFENNIHRIEEFFNYDDKVSEVSSKIEEFFNYDDKVSKLSLRIETLTEELSHKINTTEFEKGMLSHLMVLDENLKSIRSEIKGINREDLRVFKSLVSNLEELVNHSIKNEIPKHKKLITDSEFKIFNNFEKLSSSLDEELKVFDGKIEQVAQIVDDQLTEFTEEISNTKKQVLNVAETYKKLHKIVENKTLKENEKLEQYEQVLNQFNENIENFENQISQSFDDYKNTFTDEVISKIDAIELNVNEKYDALGENVNSQLSIIKKDFADVKSDVLISEHQIKKLLNELELVDEYLQKNDQTIIELKEDVETEIEKYVNKKYKDILKLKEEVYSEIERLTNKIDFIRETYSKIEPESFVREVITEGGFNESPRTKNQDPLTPLDQNFVTLSQLQQHYRLFINRIQQQISTLGGGGETQLKYLDDIVGIATNPSSYDGKFLKYDHSTKKFEFSDGSISGVEIKKEGVVVGSGITVIDFDGGSISNITVSSGIATITINSEFQYFNQLLDVDVSGVNDKYVIMYDAALQKFIPVDPDDVLSASVTTNAGISTVFIDALDVDLDNKIDLDAGSF
jgi:hypothetical protein